MIPKNLPEQQLDEHRYFAAANGARMLQAGSSSFAAAARLFDSSTRESTVMLYAWCRHCDDVIDGQSLGRGARVGAHVGSLERLAELEHETRLACAGRPGNEAVFIGLAEVVRKHELPIEWLEAHLSGFRMDVEQVHYQSLDDTLLYCDRVAGVVGLMMARVMGARDESALSCGRDLGIAFQLSNIARDVIEDAEIGRIYLPESWLQDAGIAPDELQQSRHREALATVVSRVVDAADPYYASALGGISALPLRSAWSVATARDIYRAIGHKVKQRGARAWDDRTTTSGLHKLWFAARALALHWPPKRWPEPIDAEAGLLQSSIARPDRP